MMFCGTISLGYDDYEDRWDQAVRGLLLALLAFMPLAFGAVEAWSEEVVVLLVAAMSVCFVVRAVTSASFRLVWTWAYVPLLLFLVAVVVQLVPLPVSVVRLISPNTVARKLELLGDLPGAQETLSRLTITFYPHATKHDLRLVLAVVSVFIIALNTLRRPEHITRLLLGISIIGACFAVLTVAQNLFGNGKIYWIVPTPLSSQAHSGPFVNHSHYSQYMNLSVGAAVGLMLMKIREGYRHRRVTAETIAEYLSSPEAKNVWLLGAFVLVGISSVFISMSRGGVISVLVAGAFTAFVLSLRGSLKGSGWIMVLMALGAFVCVLYIGFDAVYDRLATLGNLSALGSDRWQIVKDIAVAWTRFPILGTGLGTHAVVYPEFDRSTIPALATHAENEYAQTAEEMGLAGLLCLVAFAIIVWVNYGRAVKRTNRSAICMVAYGLGYGLVAIMVHSLSDFGQHVPANAMLTVIFCAILIRLSRIEDGEAMEPVARQGWRRWRWVGGMIVAVLVWGGVLLDADRARLGESHWRKVLQAERDFQDRRWEGTLAEYHYLLDHASQAAACEPGNVSYQHWLNVYRWYSVSQTTDPNTGEIVWPAEAEAWVGQIVDEFNRARLLCPTFGATWCVLGQIERVVLGQADLGAQHIREGVKLAPCDPVARLVAATLEAEEGVFETARNHFQAVVDLDDRHFEDVATQLIMQFSLPELALELAGDDVERLTVVSDLLETSGADVELVQGVREQVMTLLEEKCQGREATGQMWASLGQMYRRDDRAEEAVQCFEEALRLDFSEVHWRLSLAEVLAEVGELEAAVGAARECLLFQPEYQPAQRLLNRLSTDPRLGLQGLE